MNIFIKARDDDFRNELQEILEERWKEGG